MSGHTPGPWTLTKDPEHLPKSEDDAVPYWFIEGGSGTSLMPPGFHISSFLNEPDARLIAAAPDLLEACKEFYAIHTADCGNAQEFRDRLQMARVLAANAIAKAEGK